jgi:hypothetical protein
MRLWGLISQKDRIERWENVLRVLESLSTHERRNHWDMRVWGQRTECGTVACAAGHCGLDPWFRRRGFKLDFYSDDWTSLNTPVEGLANTGQQSVVAFFGREGCSDIFFNTTPRSVSQVIREVKYYLRTLRTEE